MSESLVLEKYEIDIINRNIESDQMKLRAINVFEFIKELIIENNGFLRISIKNLNASYSKNNYKFSDSVMKQVIEELIKLNLLKVNKTHKVITYYLSEENHKYIHRFIIRK